MIWVHSGPVSGLMAAPSLAKRTSAISNLERIKSQTFESVKDWEKREMLEPTRCRLCGWIWQRYLSKYLFDDIVNNLKLTLILERILAVLITLTPGLCNKLVDCQKANVRIAVRPLMDLETQWNSTVQLLKQVFPLEEFTHKRLKNTIYSDYRSHCTTHSQWTIIK
jgi:hypothetical protein